MTNRAIGRLAVLALAGTFIFAALPAMAASADKGAESSGSSLSKHPKKTRVAHPRAEAPRNTDKDQAKVEAKAEAKTDALPTGVADARAQLSADDVKIKPAGDASVQATPASDSATQDAAVQVVNADELNDLDKAATDATEPFAKLSPSVANSRAELRDGGLSPWAQTSTIGKAFIAFGVMLTLASAARMFMA